MQTTVAPAAPQAPPVPSPINTGLMQVDAQIAYLRGHIASYESQQAQLQRGIDRAGSSVERSERITQLQQVTATLTEDRAQLDGLQQQLRDMGTQFQVAPAPGVIVVPQEEHIFGYSKVEFVALSSMLLLLPLVITFCVRIVQRGARRPVQSAPALPAMDEDRLMRLEQAMDSVAIEIERIGEAQRFQTKLMSEPRRDLKPVITPH